MLSALSSSDRHFGLIERMMRLPLQRPRLKVLEYHRFAHYLEFRELTRMDVAHHGQMLFRQLQILAQRQQVREVL